MDDWSSHWREFAIFLVILCRTAATTNPDKDISQLFQQKEDNPPELNDFLSNVNEHRGDFNFVRQAAQRFKKMKKNVEPEVQNLDLVDLDDIYSGYDFLNKPEMKRHVHSAQGHKNKRYHRFNTKRSHFSKPDRVKRFNRFRRRTSPEENLGRNSEEFLDFASNSVHKSGGGGKNRHNINVKESKNEGNDMYVDISEDGAKNRERTQDNPKLPNLDEIPREVDGMKMNRVMPHLEIAQPNPGEDANFEKAQTFELDSDSNSNPNENFDNNPQGNNLLSVDSGQVETYFNGPPQEQMVNNPLGRNEPHNRLGLVDDAEELSKSKEAIKFAPKNYQLSIEPRRFQSNELTNSNPKRISQKVGNGFIEITKNRRNDLRETPRSLKKSKKPPRSKPKVQLREEQNEDYDDIRLYRRDNPSKVFFRSRNLKFFLDDDMMINSDVADSDLDYDRPVPRVRRDFLDALGMSNEEEYGEDNSYKTELNVNNTDVKNDTHIAHAVTVNFSLHCGNSTGDDDNGGGCKGKKQNCHFPPTEAELTTMSNQKVDVNNIKQILEEPKQNANDGAANESFKKIDRRSDDSFEDFNDVVEDSNPVRQNRDVSLQFDVDSDESVPIFRQQSKFLKKRYPDWAEFTTFRNNEKLRIFHRINKKEDSEGLEMSETQSPSSTACASTSDNYEKVAHEIDKENEKLAEVVDGRTASKIVSTVFDKLRSKSSLKTKFYSGLSRKHLNYAGTVDFNIFKANETHEDVAEAKILLNQITKVLNKLVMNQVRRRLCQRLPDELHEFLKTIVDVKCGAAGNEGVFVPNSEQGDFLFENYNSAENSPFNAKQLQETLVSLESLLLKYHKMNDDCQNRAEPIKDYIERHINILRQIVSSDSFTKKRSGRNKEYSEGRKRNAAALSMFGEDSEEDKLVQQQLESVGLGSKRHSFVPNFDVNKIVKTHIGDENDSDGLRLMDKRDVGNKFSKSAKFKKLQTAARIIREKRENVRKISQLYSDNSHDNSNVGKSKRSIGPGKFQGNFEQPVVYSIG